MLGHFSMAAPCLLDIQISLRSFYDHSPVEGTGWNLSLVLRRHQAQSNTECMLALV